MKILNNFIACFDVYSYVETSAVCAIDAQRYSFSVKKRRCYKIVAPIDLPVSSQWPSAGWRDINADYLRRFFRQAVDNAKIDLKF